MPQIHNLKLHSFSSEDPNFPAKNLLNTTVTKKWKCEKPGEKSAFVVLKLEKPYQISEINIGNEFSGIIEVLVANSLQDPPVFKELLLATSFMTFIEARNELNPNRLRMFTKQVFVKDIAEKKWDLVKVVCTQPHISCKQYGISFINIFTNEEVNPNNEDNSPIRLKLEKKNHITNATPSGSKPSGKSCGKFFFRDSSDSDDDDKNTSPFAKWKMRKAEFAAASGSTDLKSTIKENLKEKLASEQTRKRSRETLNNEQIKKDRNRSKGLIYDSDDDAPNEKLQKKIDKDKEMKEKEKHQSKFSNLNASAILAATSSSPKLNKFSAFIGDSSSDVKSTNSNSSINKSAKNVESEKRKFAEKAEYIKPKIKSPSKIQSVETKPKSSEKPVQYKPFNKLLEGVTIVLSGYQNPERGIIRQKALDMGACYKMDWDSSCTHLVCSYSNTPKYNQVKGKGKIISKKWIESCFTEQKRLPWRRFALDSSDKKEPESEDEIFCEWHKSKANNNRRITDESDDDDMLIVDNRETKRSPVKIEIVDDSDSDGDMKVVCKSSTSTTNDDNNRSNNNNNDDNEVFKENDDNKNIAINNQVQDYSDDSISSIDITTVECEAFKNRKFYLNQDLTATDKILLTDHIKQMLGVVTKNPYNADFIIAKLGKSLPINAKAEVIKEVWVRECYELKAFIPTARYKIT